MTDFTSSGTGQLARSHRAAPKGEYYAYFAIIFVAALPFALATWTLTATRRAARPAKGPIAGAWTQARIITPKIFAA